MQAIKCPHCNKQFELTDTIQQQVIEQVRQEDREEFQKELEKVKFEEKEKTEKKIREEIELKLKDLENEQKEEKERRETLLQDLLKEREENRALKKKDEERELENQKKLQTIEEKAKEDAQKRADELTKDKLLQLQKQLDDTKKLLEDAQRKSNQVSQQLQGEVLELELENMLRNAFTHDEIEAVGKGVHGADIRHVVKSPLGNTCGIILWESKKTKEWKNDWIAKLKDDLRAGKAHFATIVSNVLPKDITSGIGYKEGIYICTDKFVLFLAEILRKNLYDVTRQKAAMINSTEKAHMIISYLTSGEFQQHVESIVEPLHVMQEQLTKEKIAYERMWKVRETQIMKALHSTANIYGSLEGRIGASMPQIKGLEIAELVDSSE